jgi:type IV pilus assembly protein PilQ
VNLKFLCKNKNKHWGVIALKCIIISKSIIQSLLIVSFLAVYLGCADGLKNTKRDPFFEKWSTLAEDSKGHTPVQKPKKIDLSTLAKQSSSTESVVPAGKQLPTKKINLTMRQAELKSVLRALARAVNLNILVKNDLKGETTIDFRGVPWDQAFTGLLRTYGLSYIWEGDILRVMTTEDIDHDLKQKTSMRDIKWVEPLLQPVLIKIDYADAEKLQKTLEDFLTKDKDGKPRGSVKVDTHSNSLVISAMQNDLVKMLPIIEQIDKPTSQILIKANIVETTKDTARDLGIMWGGMYKGNIGGTDHYITPGGSIPSVSSSGTGIPFTSGSGGYTPTAGSSSGIAGQGFGVNFPAAGLAAAASGSLGLVIGSLGGNLLEVQLQALQKDSKLNILSSPSITTLDNQLAFTENGQRVPFVTLTPGAIGTAPTQTVIFENAVLRLEITPHVIDGKNLKMKIMVAKDELDFSRAASMLGNPIIIKKKTDTSLIVKDGETIVISGLTKQTITDGNTGFPWLKDIPVLGWLFKADSKEDKMEEILIFITPHILQVASEDPKAVSLESDSRRSK